MDVLRRISVIQHRHIPCGDYFSIRIGPSDSGSRSTSGDTGEGKLRIGITESRVECERYVPQYCNICSREKNKILIYITLW